VPVPLANTDRLSDAKGRVKSGCAAAAAAKKNHRRFMGEIDSAADEGQILKGIA
jgi:hypothetical protein